MDLPATTNSKYTRPKKHKLAFRMFLSPTTSKEIWFWETTIQTNNRASKFLSRKKARVASRDSFKGKDRTAIALTDKIEEQFKNSPKEKIFWTTPEEH